MAELRQAIEILTSATILNKPETYTEALLKYEQGTGILLKFIESTNSVISNDTRIKIDGYFKRIKNLKEVLEQAAEQSKALDNLSRLTLPSTAVATKAAAPQQATVLIHCKYSSSGEISDIVFRDFARKQLETLRVIESTPEFDKLFNISNIPRFKERKEFSFNNFRRNGALHFAGSSKEKVKRNYMKSVNLLSKAFDCLHANNDNSLAKIHNANTQNSKSDARDWLYECEYEELLSKVKRCFVDFFIQNKLNIDELSDNDQRIISNTFLNYPDINAGILLADYFLKRFKNKAHVNNDNKILDKFSEWSLEAPHCDFSKSGGGDMENFLKKCNESASPTKLNKKGMGAASASEPQPQRHAVALEESGMIAG